MPVKRQEVLDAMEAIIPRVPREQFDNKFPLWLQLIGAKCFEEELTGTHVDIIRAAMQQLSKTGGVGD